MTSPSVSTNVALTIGALIGGGVGFWVTYQVEQWYRVRQREILYRDIATMDAEKEKRRNSLESAKSDDVKTS